MNRREFFKYIGACGVCLFLPKPFKANLEGWRKARKNPEWLPDNYKVILRGDVPKDTVYIVDPRNFYWNGERVFEEWENLIITRKEIVDRYKWE